MAQCGKPTRKGTPCGVQLRAGRCFVHDCDLSARNKAVSASYSKNDPAAYRAHQIRAGKAGFKVTGSQVDWAWVNDRARLWRIEHPSEPERWAIDVLQAAGLNHYQREYPVDHGSALDLAWPDARRAVEIWGHQTKPCFGESEPRAARQDRKLIELEEQGWNILVVDATRDRAEQARRLVKFAQRCQPAETGERLLP